MEQFLSIVLSGLLCTACFNAIDSEIAPDSLVFPARDVPAIPMAAETLPLEQLPSELSIPHFQNMRLQGDKFELISVLDDTSSYTRHRIAYRSNGLRISGILNMPKGEGPHPLLLLNHGYIAPSVYTNGRGLKREQDYLARQGFAVLHSDYRGHAFSDPSPDTRNVYDATLEYSMDVVNALHALKASDIPNIDTNRVGVLGHSMGGGIALNIAVAYPDLIDAIVLYAPVHAKAWNNFERWRDMRDEDDRTRQVLGTPEFNPKAWDRLSSWTYLHAIDDPILLFHGTNDTDVPVAWSEELKAELTRLQKEVRYVEYRDEKHEFIPKWPDFMQQSTEFFKGNL